MDTSGAQATVGIPGFAPFQPGEKAAAIVRAPYHLRFRKI